MSNKSNPADTETILMTLDQIGQTIDIMTNVVGRLRGYIHQHLAEEDSQNTQAISSLNHRSSSLH